ncbi:hypothetical protein FBZ96_1161 [Bradyrhizobium stylosanthis]|uniref:Uncharacterized protein n=1 Tax=Bradyrhizobium stylosanthis TaxID=1803665 RepID=A0A560CZA5_9BRAD|nr:hypothetical protein FBZ96_1161 [Bradyrhizobium stylosanthis]
MVTSDSSRNRKNRADRAAHDDQPCHRMGKLNNSKRQGGTDDRDSQCTSNPTASIQGHHSGVDGNKQWEGVYCESNSQPEQQTEPREIEGKSKSDHGGSPV